MSLRCASAALACHDALPLALIHTHYHARTHRFSPMAHTQYYQEPHRATKPGDADDEMITGQEMLNGAPVFSWHNKGVPERTESDAWYIHGQGVGVIDNRTPATSERRGWLGVWRKRSSIRPTQKKNPSRVGGGKGWVKPRYFFVQWAMFQTSESQEVRLTPVSPFV